jgi:hypothetical protein
MRAVLHVGSRRADSSFWVEVRPGSCLDIARAMRSLGASWLVLVDHFTDGYPGDEWGWRRATRRARQPRRAGVMAATGRITPKIPALRHASDRDREMAALHVGGLTFTEIARRFGCTAPHVAACVERVRDKRLLGLAKAGSR